MPYTNIDDDCALYYKKCGVGDPAILIHGSCLNLEMWNDSFDVLAHQSQIIAYDQRGYGKSILPSPKIYSHENDLNTLYENLNLEKKVNLIGLSSGAEIAVDFYLKFPNKVNSLILVSPAISGMPENDETTDIDHKILETINLGENEQTVQLAYRHPVFLPAINNTRCNSLLREIIKNHDFQTTTNNPPTPSSLTAYSKLKEIKVPTLVILGENDLNYFHMVSNILVRGISKSVLRTVTDSGHMVNMEQPDEFNKILLKFLANQKNI